MDDFISKPVDPKKLQQSLQQWLPKHTPETSVEKPEQITLPTPSNDTVTDVKAEKLLDTQEPIFDYADMRARLMNDEELIHNVAEVFLSDMVEHIKRLQVSLKDKNLQDVENQLHQIKGAAANVGGMTLSTIALKMEQAAKVGEFKILHKTLPELESSFIALKEKLEKVL
jgi:HPt (histidine-containing phosphotransfer) domain-containing protein